MKTNGESLPLPYNGQQILELRQKRQRPDDMVLVSMIGWLGEKNPCVLAKPGRSYEWRFLVGLDVLVVTNSEIDAESVKLLCDSILAVEPNYLGLWFGDKQNGVHVAFGDYRPALRITRMMDVDERRMYAGLGRKEKEL